MVDQPFAQRIPGSTGKSSGGLSKPKLPSLFAKGNDSQQRDTTRDVSTSPATDPLYGGDSLAEKENDPLTPSADKSEPVKDVAKDEKSDPFFDNGPKPPKGDENPSQRAYSFANDEQASASVAASNEKKDTAVQPVALDYRSIRSRLDKVGARNIRLETDSATGETFFRCEIPNPKDPAVLRVFEASHPEDLAAMQAVVEAVEKWVTQQGT